MNKRDVHLTALNNFREVNKNDEKDAPTRSKFINMIMKDVTAKENEDGSTTIKGRLTRKVLRNYIKESMSKVGNIGFSKVATIIPRRMRREIARKSKTSFVPMYNNDVFTVKRDENGNKTYVKVM